MNPFPSETGGIFCLSHIYYYIYYNLLYLDDYGILLLSYTKGGLLCQESQESKAQVIYTTSCLGVMNKNLYFMMTMISLDL